MWAVIQLYSSMNIISVYAHTVLIMENTNHYIERRKTRNFEGVIMTGKQLYNNLSVVLNLIQKGSQITPLTKDDDVCRFILEWEELWSTCISDSAYMWKEKEEEVR